MVLSMASEHNRLPPTQLYQVYVTLTGNTFPGKAHSTDAVTCIKSLFYHLGQIYLQGGLTAMVQSSILLTKLCLLKKCFKHSMNIPLLLH